MTRSEVIEGGLEEFRNESEQTGVAARDNPITKSSGCSNGESLQTLEPATHIRTCVNFGHLNIDCANAATASTSTTNFR